MNQFESEVAQLFRGNGKGVEVIRGGWPDILVHHKKSDSVFAVEIKQKGDTVKENQKKIISILNRAGIPTHVVRSLDDARKIKSKKRRALLTESEFDLAKKKLEEFKWRYEQGRQELDRLRWELEHVEAILLEASVINPNMVGNKSA